MKNPQVERHMKLMGLIYMHLITSTVYKQMWTLSLLKLCTCDVMYDGAVIPPTSCRFKSLFQ